jgi:hypothetical protein
MKCHAKPHVLVRTPCGDLEKADISRIVKIYIWACSACKVMVSDIHNRVCSGCKVKVSDIYNRACSGCKVKVSDIYNWACPACKVKVSDIYNWACPACKVKVSDIYNRACSGCKVKVSDDPLTIQLLFEPNGRPADVSDYYLHEKDNVCVVCGAAESYIRKNVIPREYRKYAVSIIGPRLKLQAHWFS